jgi:hypothetical protein
MRRISMRCISVLSSTFRREITPVIAFSQAETGNYIFHTGMEKVLLSEANMFLGNLWSAPVRTKSVCSVKERQQGNKRGYA